MATSTYTASSYCKPRDARERLRIAAAAALWVGALIAGFAGLTLYKAEAGATSRPPLRWPKASTVHRAPDRATLVMVLHPRCPCSRASVEELDRLMADARGRLSAQVLLWTPPGTSAAWKASGLRRRVAAIRGVEVRRDDGVEARRFDATTSGQTIVYDHAGRLVFSGGITPARGHAGDSAGRDAILGFLGGDRGRPATPVYGCALHEGLP